MVTTRRQVGGSLPVQLTSYVGRQAEMREVRRLLAGSRLVTLTGPGGVGKTRLAVQAAGSARGDFGGGVAFVDLAELNEPDLLVSKIASSLGLGNQSAWPPVELLNDLLSSVVLMEG